MRQSTVYQTQCCAFVFFMLCFIFTGLIKNHAYAAKRTTALCTANLNGNTDQSLPPIADFGTVPSATNPDTLYICNGQTIYTNNLSQNSNTYLWNFGDGYTDNQTNTSHTYQEPGTYILSLTAYSNIPDECQANHGEIFNDCPEGVICDGPIIYNFTNYNEAPNYTQSYMVFDSYGNLLNTYDNIVEAKQHSNGEFIVVINYDNNDVVPSNTLAGLYEQVENGECLDFGSYSLCNFQHNSVYPTYSNAYGAYLIRVVLPGQLTWNPTTMPPYHIIESHDAFDGFGGGIWYSYYTLTNENNQAFAFGDTIVFCIPEGGQSICCQTIIIPSTPGGIADNDAPNRLASTPLNNKLLNEADTATLVVVVMPSQAPDIACISTICGNDTAQYYTSAVCSAYTWDIAGGHIIDGQGTAQITVVWDNIATGLINLNADCGDEYCTLPSTASVPILSSAVEIAGNSHICQQEISSYSLPLWGSTVYQWSIDPPQAGTIVAGNGTQQVEVQWTNASATLQVYYYSTILNCGGAANLSVEPYPAFAINSIDNVCEGTQSTVTSNMPGYAYTWSVIGGDIVSGQNTDAITVMWTTSGMATVNATPNDSTVFCNTLAIMNVEVVPYPLMPTITGETFICPAETYLYSASPLQNNTSFIWSVVGGTIQSGQNTPNISIVWDDTTAYSLSVIRQSYTSPACSSLAATLPINSLSAAGSLSIMGNDTICPASIENYYTSPLASDLLHEWSISPASAGQIILGQGTATISVQWADSVFNNVVLRASLCGQNIDYAIAFAHIPQPVISQSNILCSNGTTTLSIADNDISQYVWFDEIGNNLSNNATLDISEGGIYGVEVVNNAGCVGKALINISQHTAPIARILASGDTVCTQTMLDRPLFAIDGTNYNFEWTMNNVAIANNNLPLYTHNATDQIAAFAYQVAVTDTSNGCVSLSNVLSIVQDSCIGNGGTGIGTGIDTTGTGTGTGGILCQADNTHFIDFSAAAIGNNCQSIVLNQLSLGDFLGFTIHWGDGSQQILNGNTAMHTYPDSIGIYNITLLGTFEHPDTTLTCNIGIRRTYYIPFSARFDIEPACLGNNWTFQDRSYYLPITTVNNWTWDFGDGSPTVSGNQMATHAYNTAGTFTVTLTISDGNCSVSKSQTIEVLPAPTLDFSVSGGTCMGNMLYFTADSINNANSYTWNFGDGSNVVGSANATHQYNNIGTYTVSLEVLNELGCVVATMPQTLNIQAAPTPEAITASDTLLCMGESATLTAPNGIAYLWTNGSTNSTIQANQSGNYVVRVTTDTGCDYTTAPVAIQTIPLPDATIYPSSDTLYLCHDAINDTIYVQPDSNYVYTWLPNGGNSHQEAVLNTPISFYVNYSVTVTDTQTGCTASDSVIKLTSNPPYPPNVIVNATSACEGESVVLTTEHDWYGNFVWTNGVHADSITVSTSGEYGVFIVKNGCVSDTSELEQVYINPLPNVALFPVGCYELCAYETLSMPAEEGATFQWFFNGNPIGDNDAELIPTEDGDYYVIITNATGCSDTSGVLHLQINMDCPSSLLPISLLDFGGTAVSKGNQLYWASASEINCAYYTLSYSPDGNRFSPIANINGQGNSNVTHQYHYLHEHKAPLSYYSLSQTDINGVSRHLSTIVVRGNSDKYNAVLSVYPNPTQTSLQVNYESNQVQATKLQIYDVVGRLLYQQNADIEYGTNLWTLDIAHLPSGLYYLHLNGEVQRIVKE